MAVDDSIVRVGLSGDLLCYANAVVFTRFVFSLKMFGIGIINNVLRPAERFYKQVFCLEFNYGRRLYNFNNPPLT